MRSICLGDAWQWIGKLGALPVCKDASFQAPQHPLNGLALGRFRKNEQAKNDALVRVLLFMELMISASMVYLPCGCMALDQQPMTCMSGCIPLRPHSIQQMG